MRGESVGREWPRAGRVLGGRPKRALARAVPVSQCRSTRQLQLRVGSRSVAHSHSQMRARALARTTCDAHAAEEPSSPGTPFVFVVLQPIHTEAASTTLRLRSRLHANSESTWRVSLAASYRQFHALSPTAQCLCLRMWAHRRGPAGILWCLGNAGEQPHPPG
jgi:hypothetical protein